MFNLFKRLFSRPRLIERYEDLDAIIEAHNALIKKTLDIMRDPCVPAKYVLSRFKAIQDAEEKAIAAYWRNKNKKQDKWYRREKPCESSDMSDIVQEKAAEQPSNELLEPPPIVEALPSETTIAQPLEQPERLKNAL